MTKVLCASLFPLVVLLPALIGLGVAQPQEQEASTTHSLEFVADVDLEGVNCATPECVYADKNYIFFASTTGQLDVLDASKPGYPVVHTVQVSTMPLNAVRGDGERLYVTAENGSVYVFEEKRPFTQSAPFSPSGHPLESLALNANSLFFSQDQGAMAKTQTTVFLSQLNQGDTALRTSKQGVLEQTYGSGDFPANTTVAFNAATGEVTGSVSNPPGINGEAEAVAIYANGSVLALASPGCCGAGVALYNENTLKPLSYLDATYADSVVTANSNTLLVVGTESGVVELYNISHPQKPVWLSGVDLQQIIGNVVEVRSLWLAPDGKTIYAASTGGENQTTITFFVLKIA